MKKIYLLFALTMMVGTIIPQDIQNQFLKNGGISTSDVQVINIPQGWSSISGYVLPENTNIELLFQSEIQQLIIVQNLQGVYYPENQLNTLGNWDATSGYMVKFSEAAIIELEGNSIADKTLNLATGWSLIPVISECPVDVAALFAGLDPAIVKEVAGLKLYWPAMEITTLQQLLPGNAYFVLMNAPGTITFPECGWSCGEPLVDTRDGRSYETVKIGSQCWMAENLNIGTLINGNSNQTNNGVIEKYCYNNSEALCDIHGGLYQWNEMMAYSTTSGEQGICPAGWHIPTDDEWCALEQELDLTIPCSSTGWRGVDGGGKLKEEGIAHWLTPNTGATNSSGFTALPGGSRGSSGSFSLLSEYGYWWSSSQASSNAWNRRLFYGSAQVSRNSTSKTWGFSVRCLKDESASALLPTVSTAAITEVTSTTAISGGNITDDGGADVTARGVCWSTSQTPTIADNVTTDGAGAGEFTSYLYFLTPETTYYARAYATNFAGTAYGEELSFTTDEAGAIDWCQPFTDTRDNRTYETVQIGTQCWMAENLSYLPEVSPSWQGNDPNPYYFVYGYQGTSVEEAKVSTNYQTYGVLYNWHAALVACPAGWHLPSDDEWCILEQQIDPAITCSSSGWRGVDGGGKLKEAGTTHWNSPNTGATNSSGFTALPGGLRNSLGSFDNLSDWGYWWSSSQIGGGTAWSRYLNAGSILAGRYDNNKLNGFSVRCLKDYDPTLYNLNLEVSPSDAGMVSGQGNYIMYEQVNITATANPGWEFVNWSDDDGIVSELANFTYTMPLQSITLTANFIEEQGSYTCGQPLVDLRDGQSYATVQIGTQCWMAENLNIGTRIIGTDNQTNNSVIEKYCYNNSNAQCDVYGGLYQWNEMMQYSTTPGVKGICPEGWHLPTDDEWCILEQEVDPTINCSSTGWRGTNGGGKLKAIALWTSPNVGATNSSGFTALPGGYRNPEGSFILQSNYGGWWSSSQDDSSLALGRGLYNSIAQVYRDNLNKSIGNSVRCIKDN